MQDGGRSGPVAAGDRRGGGRGPGGDRGDASAREPRRRSERPGPADGRDGVAAILPWYASVHRGAGFKSRVSTELYERAREAIRAFVGGRPDDAVVITRNTTHAINLLASALPERTTVLVFTVEHHANMLPWRHGTHHGRVRYLPVPSSPDDLVARLDAALREERAGGSAPGGSPRAGTPAQRPRSARRFVRARSRLFPGRSG